MGETPEIIRLMDDYENRLRVALLGAMAHEDTEKAKRIEAEIYGLIRARLGTPTALGETALEHTDPPVE